jgi:hypothetical protein
MRQPSGENLPPPCVPRLTLSGNLCVPQHDLPEYVIGYTPVSFPLSPWRRCPAPSPSPLCLRCFYPTNLYRVSSSYSAMMDSEGLSQARVSIPFRSGHSFVAALKSTAVLSVRVSIPFRSGHSFTCPSCGTWHDRDEGFNPLQIGSFLRNVEEASKGQEITRVSIPFRSGHSFGLPASPRQLCF